MAQPLGWEDPLEKEMATHYSIFSWKIPWTEETGGLYSPWGHKESDTTEQLTLPLLKVLRLRIIKKTFQYEKNVGCLFLAKKVLGIKVHFVKGK